MKSSLIIDSLRKQNVYIKEVQGKSSIRLWCNAIKCMLLYGATPSDWFTYEMYKYSHRANKEIITNKKNRILDRMFNPKNFANDFDDKVRFNTIYKDFVIRDWLYLKGCDTDNAVKFVEVHKSVVIKPIGLSSGKGIHLFEIEKDDIQEIIELCGKEYMLEERIVNVEELQRLNPSSCQTLRITTMITSTGDVKILSATIRVGGGKEIVDNFHSSGVAYPIHVQDGVVSGAGKNLKNQDFVRHPSTGYIMPGYQIPLWNDVIDFVTRAALQNPKARFIGWDVAITPNGCDMVEGNYFVGCRFLQIFDKTGKYSYLKSFK